MAGLNITENDIPDLHGKKAVITGGSSGIGFAAATILTARGAEVFILDIEEPEEHGNTSMHWIKCDISKWSDLVFAFAQVDVVHIAIANAGVSEDGTYLSDKYDESGNLLEPSYKVIDVNFKGTLNFIKLACNAMRTHSVEGSVVITSSATAYAAEQSLPVYSGTKAALVNFMRAMRSYLRDTGITINVVAPAATITKLLPADLAAPILAANLPVSTAHFVGLAVVYSAVATESKKVQSYGRDTLEWERATGRWNGRTILTHGDVYAELEGPLSDTRHIWFGDDNVRQTRLQQSMTDFRAGN
ncbi:hypothetical protein JX265_005125 [Neoarthrinium moseri]|uniref:Uncharacterized protein n=1 Tax=Neoarthrinium moseri TaxID=1658444 RepID=A0A9P9WPT8_9PEZI|nr:hypothetical protein JX265_005125 [Neoarthrinium moseri]